MMSFLSHQTCLINALKEIHESEPCDMLIHSSVLMNNKHLRDPQVLGWPWTLTQDPGAGLGGQLGGTCRAVLPTIHPQLPGLPPPPLFSQFPPHTLSISLHKKPHSLFAQYTFTIVVYSAQSPNRQQLKCWFPFPLTRSSCISRGGEIIALCSITFCLLGCFS